MKTIRSPLTMTVCACMLLLAVACSRGSGEQQARQVAKDIAAAPGGSDKACKLFSQQEIADALDATVDEAKNWGMSQGCQWSAGGQNEVQAVLVEDRRYWENLAKTEGGEALAGIGEEAFVASWLGSFRAGALTPQGSVYVMSPKRDVSVALLRKAVERVPTL